MPTTSSTVAPDLATLCAARTAALRAYDQACNADGVPGSVWRLIGADLDAACDALESRVGAEYLRGTRARAYDAGQVRATYADRMDAHCFAAAATMRSIPVVVIEVVS